MKDTSFLSGFALTHATSWPQAPIEMAYKILPASQSFGFPNVAAPEQLADIAPIDWGIANTS